MENLTARDIMTASVVTVTPDATLRAVAELLVEKGISGVPVTGNSAGMSPGDERTSAMRALTPSV